MNDQGRNELCGCGRRKKYKKCCGRFTLEEMTAKLAAYAAANRNKNSLIERSLKFLKACEIDGSGALLVLVNPVVKDDVIGWTTLGGREIEQDVREAVVTRRILAGYLPLCVLVEDKSSESGCRAVIDATLVSEEMPRRVHRVRATRGDNCREDQQEGDTEGRLLDDCGAVGGVELPRHAAQAPP